MMIVKATLLFLLAYTASAENASGENESIENGVQRPLSWPAKYNVEATKLYLTSGLVENLKYWKSKTMSRLDSNNGAVTRISRPHIKPYGLKYEIHPETTEEDTNEKVCYKTTGSDDTIEDIDFLPMTNGYQRVGRDVVRSINCVKYTKEFNFEEVGILYKHKLWVSFDGSNKSLVPVRYESQMGNIRHGYLMSHEIYDFFNFHPKVDYKVFKAYENYECKDAEDEDEGKTTAIDADRLQSLNTEEKKELDKAFELYKKQFNKKYAHRVEHEMRKSIFHEKWRLVTETNQRNLSYKLVLNKMSDCTEKELKRYKGLRKDKPRIVGNVRFPYSEEEIKKISEALPPEYDLRLEGVVGPVLDQDDCGSCWSFGTTAAVEGALARSNGGTLITLSNQALLDCSWGTGNTGCDGGTDIAAYKWIMKHGLPTVEEYGPYMKEDGYCNIENMTNTYKIRGWTDVTPLSEEALKIAIIKHGPLSVSIDATSKFTHYDGGIFYDTDCDSSTNDLNHEVTLVGYGEKEGESFWIIRNSYGPYWGLDGYMHISTRNNNCGIMTEPTYVVIK